MKQNTKMNTKTKTLEKVDTGLTIDNRAAVIQHLNHFLADEHLLYTKTRKYHWNLTGSTFATLHEFFEEQYNRLQVMADEIAERTRMLGGTAPGTMSEFMEETCLSETPGVVPSIPDMLDNLLDDHEVLISSMRKVIDSCSNEYNDEGTADLLIGLMRSHEQMAWMLRSSQPATA